MQLETVYSDQLISHHIHTHVHYEMLYLTEGWVSMRILGREYEAGPGDMIFLNQFEEHATRLLQSPYRRYYVLIPPNQLQAFGRDGELLSVFRLHGGSFPYVLHTGEKKPLFDAYFSGLMKIHGETGKYREMRLEALLTLILTQAQLLRPDLFRRPPEASLLPIQEILDILDRDYAEDFSLERLARRYHVSPGCLSMHFRQYVGMSPMQYVTQSRLTQAKRLLLETEQSVQAIAAQCGFADQSNFSRRFRQQFQCTPLKFRQKYRSGPGFPMKR